MQIFDAFDFNQVNTKDKNDKLISSVKGDMIKAALLMVDLSKLLYSVIGIDKPKGFKLMKEPFFEYPAFGKISVSSLTSSKYITNLLKILKDNEWKTICYCSNYGVETYKYIVDKEYYDDFIKPLKFGITDDYKFVGVSLLMVSPDNGLCFVAYKYYNKKIYSNQYDAFLTFTGNKIYNTDNLATISKEEKQLLRQVEKKQKEFVDLLKRKYGIQFPVYSNTTFNYDVSTDTCTLTLEYEYPERDFGYARGPANIVRILNKNITKYWKCIKKEDIEDINFGKDEIHWIYVSSDNKMKCDLCWNKITKKGTMSISDNYQEENYGKNSKGEDIVPPINPNDTYINFSVELKEFLNYITADELNKIKASKEPFIDLLKVFKDKWM